MVLGTRMRSWLSRDMFARLCLLGIIITANGFVNSPKIITKNGNLIFESGLNRNISFRLLGSSRVNINNEFDILEMLQFSQHFSGRNATAHTSGAGWPSLEGDNLWRTASSEITALKVRVFGAQGIDKQLRRLQNRTRAVNQIMRRYQTRLQAVETKVQTMFDRLEVDNCRSNPCENGGTCFSMYNGFICKCPKTFEGPTCDSDVNECAMFAGTDLGCQNGGQCVNQHGGYSCICSSGWFGIHCSQRRGDCLQSSAWELCGHGTCVGGSNENFGYKCICDQGWKTNGLTPACNVDVDECVESHPPCTTSCINLPGSFTCAPCPPGLTGNGVNCRDIDECANNNGHCSTNPLVACINSYGSFHCGECPLGFTGDGKSCVRRDNSDGNGEGSSCAEANICHPSAVCSEVSNTVVCTCPLGMLGSGIGVNGCLPNTAIDCNSSPCLNGGTCIDQGSSYMCLCLRGFRPPNCAPIPSPCLSNPCLNNGHCVPLGGSDFKCTCAPGFAGRLCDNRYSRCGGILSGTIGRLKYPESGLYGHSSQCAWVLRTNETLVLNVTFNSFEMEDSTECRFDWLQINDGRTAASQIIGRFCGIHKPLGGNIISTTNHLYLWFRSDNSTARAGFDLSWTSMAPLCGGLIEFETHGTIKTPGSPGNYPKNRDCHWQLRAPNTKRIKLAFFSLQIENHNSCNFDFVQITDALNGVVLEKFCNSSNPTPITLPTNQINIHFHSDNEGGDTGFQIHYSAEQRIPGCGGTFTLKQDTIRSPDITQESISCEYDIRMAAGETINVVFTKFEMGSDDCIEIYDVDTGKQVRSLQGKYCGYYGVQPTSFTSLYNALQIRFYSKGGTFELQYKAECSYLFESNSDVITSPNYPRLSNVERFCAMKIVTAPNTVISVNLIDFDMNDNSLESEDCAYTYLKMYDGLNQEAVGTFCGNSTPPTNLVTKVNVLRLDFQSSITSYGKGFKMEYRTLPMEHNCGGVFTKLGHTIRLSTGDDGLYANDMECYWVIMAPRSRGIMLLWKSFNVEESSDCTYDYLEVYDNMANSENDKPLGRYCNSRRPPAIQSHSNILTLKFVSDFSEALDGFEATYDFIDYTKSCGGDILSSAGELNSPQWPLNYSNNLDCVWTISAPEGTQIELQFNTFDIEDVDNCAKDWLEIRNGGSPNSTLVGLFCGKKIPHVIPSFTNQMRLHFHTDAFVNSRGFKVKWYVFSNNCGGNLKSNAGVITSPLYPHAYLSNAQCEWFVRVNQGSSIHFVVEDLEIEDLYQCHFDHLDIHDGRTSTDYPLAKLCRLDKDKPREFVTSGHEALVRFTTDNSNNERGFFMSYYANCSRTLTALHGAIESSNYGNNYRGSDVNCSWTLKAPKGNRVLVDFSYFDSKEGAAIYLTEVAKNGSFLRRTLSKAESFNSSGDTLIITHNNSLVTFRLEYIMVGCIEILHRESGEFHSPGYPNSYPNDVECVWEIRTALGQGIELKIEGFDIEESVNCTRDGLQISTHDHSTNPKERHCGKQGSLAITSGSHRLFVRFYSDSAHNGKGFNATYRSIKSQCGGEISSRNGVIQSPNYPQDYPPDADCEWVIEVSEHHTITFTLEELDVEEYFDCGMDSVELYDLQDSEEPRKLFQKCGQLEAGSNQWTTTSNTALIRFQSDESEQAKGFKISFQENCGERFLVENNGTGTLEKLTGFSKHDENTNETCVWQIIAQDVTKHIRFSVQHVQVNHLQSKYINEAECSDHGVKIFNGDNVGAPLLSKFCTKHPPDIDSSGHALTVRVPLNLISEFSAVYLIHDTFCSNHYYSLRGEFSTPNYPASYPVNTECTWTLESSAGNALALTIETLDLEQSDECNDDYLEVRVKNERGRLLGLFCGTSVPSSLESASTYWIKFRSNNDNVGKGFLASYNYVVHNELSGANGKIESPAYPTKFVSEEVYSWRITVDRDYVVLLTIADVIDVNIPFLKFYDGYSDIGAPLDYAEHRFIRSNTNVLYVTATHFPFSLEWHQVSKEAIRNNRSAEIMAKMCGSEVVNVGMPLVFNSPGYPNGYGSNLHCSWTIMPTNAATHAVVQFVTLDLEDFSNCAADYVRVSASNDLHNWRELVTLCKKIPNTLAEYKGTPYLKVDFITDVSQNKTGFSSYLLTSCGSEMSDPMAFVNISSLLSTFSILELECVWTIRVRQGRRIRITFPDSYLHDAKGSANCHTYFLVRNGFAADSPFLGKGKYCENDINDVLETTSNHAYIKFSRSSFAQYRASFHYEEIVHECSDEVVLSDAIGLDHTKTLTSPKYPNLPNPHSECIWKVVAPVHHVIALSFFDKFDLIAGSAPVTTACDREYVQVNDGATELMPLLGRFCGTTKPDTVYSSGNVLRIKYFTDVAEPHIGFKANVSIGRCGGTYFNSEGSISSPVGLKFIGKEREFECVYTIEVAQGSTINLTMDSMDLPDAENCTEVTHIELQEIDMYAGWDTENVTDVLRICGHFARRYIVETNKLVVRYKIKDNPTTTNYGFKFSYKAIGSRCGDTIIADQGILQTPGYPGGVSHPTHCLWRVRVPKGRRVKVEFLDFDTGSISFMFNEVRKFRGRISFSNDFEMQSIIARISHDPPPELHSTDNTMAIDAFLLPFSEHRGFKLRFSSDEESVCRPPLDLSKGSLQFSRSNDSSMYCSYELAMRSTETLAIHVEKYEKYTEPFNNNFCSVVSPIKFEFNSEVLLPDLLCKNDTRPSVRLPFPVTINLSGNNRNKLRELLLQYQIHKCGGLVPVRNNVSITQPKIEARPNGGVLECAWAVWPYDRYDVDHMTFDPSDLDIWNDAMQLVVNVGTDFKGSCEDQYLLLYNGPDPNSPHLGRYCQQSTALNLVVEHGLFFEYVTNNYEQQSTFNISVSPGTGCGGKLTYPYRTITFTSRDYKNNVECVWDIIAEPGFHIGLSFEDRFFIESSPQCKKDYLKVQQRDVLSGEWKDLQTICGRDPPAAINSTMSDMRLIFRSDEANVGEGFIARFERNCGGIFYARKEKQQLSTPGYPEKYDNNLSCNYTVLSSDPSVGLVVRFLKFELEQAPVSTCLFDNVTVYVKQEYEPDAETVLCGRKQPHDFRSKEQISLVLRTDTSFAYGGFLLEYSSNFCGGHITNASTIETPKNNNYPEFPSDSHCYWNLSAPTGHQILIKFEELDYEDDMFCMYDGVEIYQGNAPVDDQRLAKFCGNLTNSLPSISIPSNSGLIYSYSDKSEASRGFRALVNFIPKCDKKIFLGTSNSSYQFNEYAGSYANNLDCSYVFSTVAGRQLKVEFNTFHIEDSDACIDDFLEIRDGAGTFSDLIGSFCGHALPQMLMSSKNVVFMRFVTDSRVTSSGFEARITSIPAACGNHNLELNSTKTIELKSPDNGNGLYLPNLNCFWKIKAETTIHLNFEKFDLQEPNSNGTCDRDSLKLFNEEDDYYNVKGLDSQLIINRPSGSRGEFHFAPQHVYCGSHLPDDYFTASKELLIKFTTDNSIEKSGFKIIATAVAGCFRNYTGTQGRIALAETANHCDVYIRAPQNYSLSLYYEDTAFAGSDCDKEYLEVFDAKTNTSLQKDCSYIGPGRSLFSNHSELRLNIRMDTIYSQFYITYLASRNGPGCGGDLYNTAGIITNPFYPNNVRENSDCRWNIRVPSNLRVFLSFDVFDLGAKSTCHSDYLQIIEYNEDKSESIVRQLCGEDQPSGYKSNHSFLTVRFHKTVNYDGTGWVLQFFGVYANSKIPRYYSSWGLN